MDSIKVLLCIEFWKYLILKLSWDFRMWRFRSWKLIGLYSLESVIVISMSLLSQVWTAKIKVYIATICQLCEHYFLFAGVSWTFPFDFYHFKPFMVSILFLHSNFALNYLVKSFIWQFSFTFTCYSRRGRWCIL